MFLPELALTLGLLLVVLVDASGVRARNALNHALTLITLALALGLCTRLPGEAREIWGGMLVLDPMAVFFKELLILASILVVAMFTIC